ncbi:SRA-YDG [Pisolithus croceorrhizus]|nr:SRA-YDG [Pisolithus croceorrhizus]
MSSTQAATGRVYGHIPGYPVGSTFKTKEELWRAGVHVQRQAGIHGDASENGGAFSICLSEGYEDNIDSGERIIYVGSGGLLPSLVDQVTDQSFDHLPNRALQLSCETKRPVRVVRGKNETSFYSPPEGYRYDGLYVVDEAYMKRGKKGFQMCTFKLRRIQEEGMGPIPTRRLLTSKKLQKIARGK